jgi:uncharacterized tellurite resistance protein B-like protein
MATSDIDHTLRNIIVFTLADGVIHDVERQYIHAIGAQLEISAPEIEDVIAEVQAGKKSITIPQDSDDARRLVHYLVQAAAVDHDISKRERLVLSKLAQRAGLTESEVMVMIEEELRALGNDSLNNPDAPDDGVLDAQIEAIYAGFTTWDAATRTAKLDELADLGRYAVVPMLRMLESYRNPEGARDALELKAMLAERLGQLGDSRAVYYLTQQVNIGDSDDEITCLALRTTAAMAVGHIISEPFTPDQAGINAVREWWLRTGRAEHDRLVI